MAVQNPVISEKLSIESLVEIIKKKDEEINDFKEIITKLNETIGNLQSAISGFKADLKDSIGNRNLCNISNNKRRNLANANKTKVTNSNEAITPKKVKGNVENSINTNIGSWFIEPNISNNKEGANKQNADESQNNGTSVHTNSNGAESMETQTVLSDHSDSQTCQETLENENVADAGQGNDWQFISHKNKKENNNKIQPIQVTIAEDGMKALYQTLTNNFGSNKFTVNQLKSKTSIRIYPASNTIAGDIMELLSQHKYEFHSYINDILKRKCFLIKGLNNFDNVNEILDQLIKAGVPNNSTLVPFSTGFQRANPNVIHNKFYKLIVNGDFDDRNLKNIKSVLGVSITFEKLKSNTVIQCHNCQQYFHTASMCYRKYRCVKCINDHEPGVCPKNKNDTLEPQCINCKGSHTANNYAKCEYYKSKIEPFIKRKTQINSANSGNSTSIGNSPLGNSANKVNLPGPSTGSNKSFSDLFKSNNPKKNVSIQAISSNNNSESTNPNKFFENMFSIMSRMLENQEKMMNHLINKNQSC